MRHKISNLLIVLLVAGALLIFYSMGIFEENQVKKTQNEVNFGGLWILMEFNEFPEEEYIGLESSHGRHFKSIDGKTLIKFEGYPDEIDELRLVEIQSSSVEFSMFGAKIGDSKELALKALNNAFRVNFETDYFKYETKQYAIEAVFENDTLVTGKIEYFTTDKSGIRK